MAQWIAEATDATFQQEVIDRSHQALVLVDFWAEWCGPCRTLTPTLETAIEGRGGKVWLVKVNVDQCPNLATEFGIRGIPAVKAFRSGQFAGEFVGVRDRSGVDQFIDGLQPAAEQETLHQAATLMAQRRFDEAKRLLLPLLQDSKYGDAAQLITAQICVAQGDLEAAQTALSQIPEEGILADQVQGLALRIELMMAAGEADEATLRQQVADSPDDPGARWALAGRLVAEGNLEQALEELLALVQRDRSFQQDGARRAMISIFSALGSDDDLVRDFRRRLQIVV